MGNQTIKVPDIGGNTGVEIIEIAVSEGDEVGVEDTLITLESDKASMEIPSPWEGRVISLNIKEGDTVSEGDVIGTINIADSATSDQGAETEGGYTDSDSPDRKTASTQQTDDKPASTGAELTRHELRVPDIGGTTDVEVIEVSIIEGREVDEEETLITLESDKASMDIPSPYKGRVVEVVVSEGDTVSAGDLIGYVEVAGDTSQKNEGPFSISEQDRQEDPRTHKLSQVSEISRMAMPKSTSSSAPKVRDNDGITDNPSEQLRAQARQKQLSGTNTNVHAGPAVRQMAREFGVELSEISPSGPKGRILKEDVERFLRNVMEGRRSESDRPPVKTSAGGQGIPPMPEIDFSQFGEVEERAMGRLRKVGASNLHRSWLNVPHVTQFDEADITDLEAYRQSLKEEFRGQGTRLTLLPFILKAVTHALERFPQFNVSLRDDDEAVLWKKYFHIGVAVDSPNGLQVPVIQDVDSKSVSALARELTDLSERAREGKLNSKDMQGGCFTISSLGAIGGTAFTPIVNAPEVAILGVSKSEMKPVWNGKEFIPRLALPLALSYDHRAVNGADAARFVDQIGKVMTDIRKLLL